MIENMEATWRKKFQKAQKDAISLTLEVRSLRTLVDELRTKEQELLDEIRLLKLDIGRRKAHIERLKSKQTTRDAESGEK